MYMYLEDLNRGGNAHYTSERFKQELIQALAETIAKPIQEHLCASPFFSLCIDETTDVSFTKQLIVYVVASLHQGLARPGLATFLDTARFRTSMLCLCLFDSI